MINKRFLFKSLLLAAATASTVFVYAEDEKKEDDEKDDKVQLDKIPAAVMQAAQAAVPGGKADSAQIENEDGAKVYEIVFMNAAGKKVEVAVAADGSVLETEQEIKGDEAPAAVTKTIKDVLPSAAGATIEKKTVTVYEVKKEVGDKTYEMVIDANGKVVSIEVASEEDED